MLACFTPGAVDTDLAVCQVHNYTPELLQLYLTVRLHHVHQLGIHSSLELSNWTAAKMQQYLCIVTV